MVAYLALTLSIICIGISVGMFYYLNELIKVFNEMIDLHEEDDEDLVEEDID